MYYDPSSQASTNSPLMMLSKLLNTVCVDMMKFIVLLQNTHLYRLYWSRTLSSYEFLPTCIPYILIEHILTHTHVHYTTRLPDY